MERLDPTRPAWPQAYKRLRAAEGGYSNRPADRGGETYAGISRRYHPTWDGWRDVDAAKADPSFPRNLDADPILQGKAEAFYRREFWDRQGLDELPPALACLVLDFSVNSGGAGIRLIQRAYNRMHGTNVLKEDGVLGPVTRGLISRYCDAYANAGQVLVLACLRERDDFYRGLAAGDPAQSAHLRGWLNRNAELAVWLLGMTPKGGEDA